MNNNTAMQFKPTFEITSFTSDDIGDKYGNIFDLAHAFLSIESMTHKKLQKLCYYAKAWYLAIYDSNLIEEQFEAWVHGAVQPRLYQEYKAYGDELERLNHSEMPWVNARRGYKPWESCNVVISEEDMKEWYRDLMSNE